jgi:hypothetical protein
LHDATLLLKTHKSGSNWQCDASLMIVWLWNQVKKPKGFGFIGDLLVFLNSMSYKSGSYHQSIEAETGERRCRHP